MSEIDTVRWNMWKINAKGQREKWLGQITDPKTGFEWIKAQGHKAAFFVINNVPPTTGATQNPTRVVQGMADGTVVRTGEVMMPRSIPGKTNVPALKDRKAAARKPQVKPFDWSEQDRKQAALRAPRRAEGTTYGSGVSVPQSKPKQQSKPVKKVDVDSELANAAQAGYNDIKRDEAADMARDSA